MSAIFSLCFLFALCQKYMIIKIGISVSKYLNLEEDFCELYGVIKCKKKTILKKSCFAFFVRNKLFLFSFKQNLIFATKRFSLHILYEFWHSYKQKNSSWNNLKR